MQTKDYLELPAPNTQAGQARKIGVEIEFGGLPEEKAAQIARETLGGELVQKSDTIWLLKDSEIGKLQIYLDVFLRNAEKTALRDAALNLGREVIPVEIVTEPLLYEDLPKLDKLVDALRDAGALGSSAGIVFGFGVHFNIEIVDDSVESVRTPLLAYALIEDWLRSVDPIDETRRVLPFTAPYPTGFVRELIGAGSDATLTDLIRIYLAHNPTRNRGLDMLPIFAHLAPDAVEDTLDDLTSARPTFHFRLPDCLIDEPVWSLAQEWKRWVVVERVASDPALLDRLSAAWLDDHPTITIMRRSWAMRAGQILADAGLAEVLA